MGFSADVDNPQGQDSCISRSLQSEPSRVRRTRWSKASRAPSRLISATRERSAGDPDPDPRRRRFRGPGRLLRDAADLSQLPGYATGGTIHIVINNQVGFTTSPKDSRSTTYCTDMAKMLESPIFHVNGDDARGGVVRLEALRRVPPEIQERRFHRPDLLPQARPQRGRRAFVHPAAALQADQGPASTARSLRRASSTARTSSTEAEAQGDGRRAQRQASSPRRQAPRAEAPQPYVSVLRRPLERPQARRPSEDIFKPVERPRSTRRRSRSSPTRSTRSRRAFTFIRSSRASSKRASKPCKKARASTGATAKRSPTRRSSTKAPRSASPARTPSAARSRIATRCSTTSKPARAYMPLNHIGDEPGRVTRSITAISPRPASWALSTATALADPNALVLWEGAVRRFRQRRAGDHRPVPRLGRIASGSA